MSAETTITLTAAGIATAAIAWASGLENLPMLGGFVGATVFVSLSSEFSTWVKLLLLFASWSFGYNTPALVKDFVDAPFITAFFGGLLCVALSSTLLEGVKTGKLPAWLGNFSHRWRQ